MDLLSYDMLSNVPAWPEEHWWPEYDLLIHDDDSSLFLPLPDSVFDSPPSAVDDQQQAASATDGAVRATELPTRIFSGISSKMENKYTLKIKSSGNGMTDDGYKWRKYGQKSIKHSPNPRSYYKCTNPRCGAKKQVEKSMDEPDTLLITYEGLHLHFPLPFFDLLHQGDDSDTIQSPPLKKAKRSASLEPNDEDDKQEEAHYKAHEAHLGLLGVEAQVQNSGSLGLLEDMVPATVRNPSAINDLMGDISLI